jgi:hypothetical protein
MKKLFVFFAIVLFCISNTHASTEKYDNWYFQFIDEKCKIFTYVEIPKAVQDDPKVNCYVLSVRANKDIVLQQVYDIDFSRELFTDQTPIEYVIKNTKTVARQFHSHGKKIILKFDKHNEISSTPSRTDSDYCIFKQQKAEKLIDLFKKKNKVVFIQEFIGWRTKQPEQTINAVFSLKGFSQAYKRLMSTLDSKAHVASQQNNTTIISPVNFIKKHIAVNNKLGITGKELRIKQNAKGDGVFVYVPKTYVVWFVVDDHAFKLNSPSSMLTPNLKWAREEKNSLIWKKTGFKYLDTTEEALRQVFGKQ